MFIAQNTTIGWRIVFVKGDEMVNLCGAVSEVVAIEQARILNKLRGYA